MADYTIDIPEHISQSISAWDISRSVRLELISQLRTISEESVLASKKVQVFNEWRQIFYLKLVDPDTNISHLFNFLFVISEDERGIILVDCGHSAISPVQNAPQLPFDES